MSVCELSIDYWCIPETIYGQLWLMAVHWLLCIILLLSMITLLIKNTETVGFNQNLIQYLLLLISLYVCYN